MCTVKVYCRSLQIAQLDCTYKQTNKLNAMSLHQTLTLIKEPVYLCCLPQGMLSCRAYELYKCYSDHSYISQLTKTIKQTNRQKTLCGKIMKMLVMQFNCCSEAERLSTHWLVASFLHAWERG